MSINVYPNAIGDIPWKWCADTQWREKTFSERPNYKKLAEYGFVYDKRNDKILCFYCPLSLNASEVVDFENIWQIHRNRSADCPMVNASQNTQSIIRSSPQTVAGPVAISQPTQSAERSSIYTSRSTTVPRVHTISPPSTIVPHVHPISPPSTTVPPINPISPPSTTVPPNNPISPPSLSADSVSSHHPVSEPPAPQHSSLAESVQSNSRVYNENNARPNQKPPTYTELGIVTERPKRNEYALLAERRKTFQAWRPDHHIKVDDLIKAGFYFAGFGDCARCFYCGGGLRNWDDQDDVYVEHARWFPKCGFIRQLMGQVFVDTVQDLMKTEKVIPYKMVVDKIKEISPSFADTDKDELSQDAAVKAVIDEGFGENDVLQAARSLKEKKKTITSDHIIDYLLKNNKHISQPLKSYPSDFIENVCKDMDEIKKQNMDLRQQTVCKICMDKEVAVVFLPCGHFVSCVECSQPLKNCPFCRSIIKGTVRAFLS